MDDRQALMAAIVADPDDDLPRLVLADWLEEHGEGDRAKFIRLQCEAARTAGPIEDKRKATGEEAELIRRYQPQWLGPINYQQVGSPYEGVGPFSRGLLRSWHGTAAKFLTKASQKAMLEWFPVFGVNELTLYNPTKKLTEVFASPALEWVPKLDWRHARVGDEALEAVAASSRVRNLAYFSMTHPRCTDAGLTAIAESKNLSRLRSFALSSGLWGGGFTTKGLLLVLNSKRLSSFESISLTYDMPISFRPAEFFRDAGLARLKRLTMYGTAGGHWDHPEGIAALATSPHVGRLESLDLSGNVLVDETAAALTDSPHFKSLKKLLLNNINNATRARLSPVVEQRLRDRFGDALSFSYGALVKA